MKLNDVQLGNAWELAKELPDESIDCIVTSPPYFGLRDYGINGQFGTEETPELYIEKLTNLFSELHRVLKPEGTVWVNLGDSYNGSGKGAYSDGVMRSSDKSKIQSGSKGTSNGLFKKTNVSGLKSKDLIGIPWMFAFAMRDLGWYLRRDIIWAKGVSGQNDIVQTVNNWLYKNNIELPLEMLKELERELFVGSCMPESVKDRCTTSHEYVFMFTKSKKYYYDGEAIKEDSKYPNDNRKARSKKDHKRIPTDKMQGIREGSAVYNKRNKRSVWCVVPKPYRGAHFATYCVELIEPMILAGCPEGGIVLDPFLGSGTTAIASIKNKRNWIGFELNEEYCEIARKRIEGV